VRGVINAGKKPHGDAAPKSPSLSNIEVKKLHVLSESIQENISPREKFYQL
jgi:hypothetical protein